MGADTIIKLENVSKSFKEKIIFNNINFEIKKNEFVGIVGESGQGKTVLIELIVGFLTPSSGTITRNVEKEKISFSIQNNSLYESLTVKQNLLFFAKINNVPKKERKERIPKILSQLKIEPYKNVLVKKLSGGTKKRVDIACALITNPSLLILDEPFTGLDKKLVEELARYILFLNKNGTTIIIISHRNQLMSQICSKALMLENKSIREISKKELINKYQFLE